MGRKFLSVPAISSKRMLISQEVKIVGALKVMSASGHRTVTWKNRKAEAGDPEAQAAVSEAERIFDEQKKRGATAFDTTTRESRVLDRFDPQVERITVVPRLTGG